MRSDSEHKNSEDIEASRELTVLSEVQSTPDTSPRRLAKRLGISLGVTNLLLRNMARKGYVRITRAGWRRWLYALTPAGFSHKLQPLSRASASLPAALTRRTLLSFSRLPR